MTTQDSINFFGSGKRLAKLLSIHPQSLYNWGEFPSELRQRQIADLSGGRLTIDNKFRLEPALQEWQK